MKKICAILVLLSVSLFSFTQVSAQVLPEDFFVDVSDADICVEEEIVVPEGDVNYDTMKIKAMAYYDSNIPGVFDIDFSKEYGMGVMQIATCSRICNEEPGDWVIVSVCGQSVQMTPWLYDRWIERGFNEDPYSINEMFGCDIPVPEGSLNLVVQRDFVVEEGQICAEPRYSGLVSATFIGESIEEATDETPEPDCIDVETVEVACFVEPEPDPVVEDEPEEETPAATTPTTPAAPAAVAPTFAISGAGCQLQAVSLPGLSALLSGMFLFGTLLISRKRKYK